MDILGIGPLEVLFILLIALIIFGPKDIVKAGQTTGQFLRKLIKSPGWQTVQKTSRELRNLPNKLVREAGLDEVQQDINTIASLSKPPDIKKEIQEELDKVDEGLSAWTSPPKIENEKVETVPSPETPSETTENN
jgi:Sec-independent protein translocase protein TatA